MRAYTAKNIHGPSKNKKHFLLLAFITLRLNNQYKINDSLNWRFDFTQHGSVNQ